MTVPSLLIVGAGLAGAKAAEGARAAGFDGPVTLVGSEPAVPYERPPLSKAVLRGEADDASAAVHEPGFYAANDIDLRTGASVRSLDLDACRAQLDDGDSLEFGSVVLATGATPRRLDVPGSELDGISYLRTLDDAARLRRAIASASRVAVVGAGWLGSEVAASARQLGADVVLIDPFPTPLYRVLGERVGSAFAALHADHGV